MSTVVRLSPISFQQRSLAVTNWVKRFSFTRSGFKFVGPFETSPRLIQGYVKEVSSNIFGQTMVTVQKDYAVTGDDSTQFGLVKINAERILPQNISLLPSAKPQLTDSEEQVFANLKSAYIMKKYVWFTLARNPEQRGLFATFPNERKYNSVEVWGIRVSAKGDTYLIDFVDSDGDGNWYFTRSLKNINPDTLSISKNPR